MKQRFAILIAMTGAFFQLNAQTVTIETTHAQLLLTVGRGQKLYQTYFGKRLPNSIKEFSGRQT